MDHHDLLGDAFQRIRETTHRVLDGLPAGHLTARIDPEANTIAWLVWHLTRVQDDHLADAFGHEQVWLADGWHERFGLPFEPTAIGYGQSAHEVGEVSAPAELLLGYHDAVVERTLGDLRGITADDLDRVVDHRWDPPVTLGVRLVSVISDDLQHAGQAAYARGVLSRR